MYIYSIRATNQLVYSSSDSFTKNYLGLHLHYQSLEAGVDGADPADDFAGGRNSYSDPLLSMHLERPTFPDWIPELPARDAETVAVVADAAAAALTWNPIEEGSLGCLGIQGCPD